MAVFVRQLKHVDKFQLTTNTSVTHNTLLAFVSLITVSRIFVAKNRMSVSLSRLTAMIMELMFLNMTPCSLLDIYKMFIPWNGGRKNPRKAGDETRFAPNCIKINMQTDSFERWDKKSWPIQKYSWILSSELNYEEHKRTESRKITCHMRYELCSSGIWNSFAVYVVIFG